jgi:hypothetical protein
MSLPWAILPLRWMCAATPVMQRRFLDGIKARVETTTGESTDSALRTDEAARLASGNPESWTSRRQ